MGYRPCAAASLLLILLPLLQGCSSGTAPSDPVKPPPVTPVDLSATSLTVTPSTIALDAGTTQNISAQVRNSAGVMASPSVTWTSERPSVATVSGTGTNAVVTGVTPGDATIRVVSGSVSGFVNVTVALPPAKLTILTSGSGSVSTQTGGVICASTTCIISVPYNQQLILNAAAQSGSIFSGWSGGCSGRKLCIVQMDKAVEVTATFASFKFVKIDAGSWHSCGLVLDGSAYCWGDDTYGQTGDSLGASLEAPHPVDGGHRFTNVVTGLFHTCGWKADGEAWCWGANTEGQLGTGTALSSRYPVKVSGNLKFKQIATTLSHNCGVAITNVVFCWGGGSYGVLGTGVWINPQTTPLASLATPDLSETAVGFRHSCARTTVQTYCWGDNQQGQLGLGTTSSYLVPIATATGFKFVLLVADGERTCGLTDTDDTYCWGQSFGTAPTLVPGGFKFKKLATNSAATCGLTATGDAYCWGDRFLGNGLNQASTTPVRVSGGLTFTQLAGGGQHFCGIVTGGDAYCWGHNTYSQLGDGSTTHRLTPVRVTP